ncbi:putative gamma-glutamylcyclotransferase CG2811 [Dermacentor andersoni]|uniref:putative gamma-glutamylcyclotransferase CG2811 n=1 Tax=Dermacentor andersoni TaxID=34620 RepID=UPI002417C9C4|nr:putative gamma-glutamylcyclotransferase CG2811 [Dermacentor andersoni]
MEATGVASGMWHLVFVYGTLKCGERNHNILNNTNNGHSTLVGQARTLKEWPLVLLSAFELPCLLPCEGVGHEVCGEVYQVDDRMLAVIDHLEWHPRLYIRSQEDVELLSQGGGRLKAWIYFVRKFDPELLSLPYVVNFTGKPGTEWPEFIGDNEETRRFIEATFPEIITSGDINEGQPSEKLRTF